MKKLLLLVILLFGMIGLQACATEEEPLEQEPIVTEPTVEDPVVEEPAELNTILSYNFGTSVNFGYAQENLEWTENGQNYSLFKNRVQINTSTFGVRAEMGAFLVFAPIKENEYAFIELNLENIIGPATISFNHITWHSINGPTNISGLDLAEVRLEVLENDEWIVLDFINLIARVNGEDLVAESFTLPSAGTYRISYVVEGATSTTNTQYALIIDDILIQE